MGARGRGLLKESATGLGSWLPWSNWSFEFPGLSPRSELSRLLSGPCAVVRGSRSGPERPLGLLAATFRAPRLPTSREPAARAPTPPRAPALAPPPPLRAASQGERARPPVPSRPVPVPGRGAAAPALSLPQLPVLRAPRASALPGPRGSQVSALPGPRRSRSGSQRLRGLQTWSPSKF